MYIIDNNVWSILLKHIKIGTFPYIWIALEDLVDQGEVLSSREVYRELDFLFGISDGNQEEEVKWLRNNKMIFTTPTDEECKVVGEIFCRKHFQQLVKKKSLLSGNPEADAFLVAMGSVRGGIVVTNETFKPNSAKIPNVCNEFNVNYIDGNTFFGILNQHYEDNLRE